MKLNLKALRKSKQLTQEQLAALIGAAKRQVGAWERGENELTLDYASAIADVLECTIDELANRDTPGVSKRPTLLQSELLDISDNITPEGMSQLMIYARGISASYPKNHQFQSDKTA